MRHGTHHAYERGCGCDECRAANAKHHRELRRRNPANYATSTHVCRECGEAVWQAKPGQAFRHTRRSGHAADPVRREDGQRDEGA